MEENVKNTLSEYDFIVVIDKSGSMSENDMPNKQSRWEAVQESAIAFSRELAKIDDDGLGVVLFSGASITAEDHVGVDRIKEIFATNRPSGSTPLAEALTAALKLGAGSSKKKFITIFTDGVPDNKVDAEMVIRGQASKQETDDELTFFFVQVGYDKSASAYLEHLDNGLSGAKFDIVCAMTQAQADAYTSVTELIVHAINN